MNRPGSFRPRAINNNSPSYWVWGSKRSRVTSRGVIKLYFKCHNPNPYSITRTIYFLLPDLGLGEAKGYFIAHLLPGNSMIKHTLI